MGAFQPVPALLLFPFVAGPTPSRKSIATAESDFALTVKAFLDRFTDPAEKVFATKVCQAWATAWLNTAPGLLPPPGTGLARVERQVIREHDRAYYQRNARRLSARRLAHYHAHRQSANGQGGAAS